MEENQGINNFQIYTYRVALLYGKKRFNGNMEIMQKIYLQEFQKERKEKNRITKSVLYMSFVE